jgi:hypothetical protein
VRKERVQGFHGCVRYVAKLREKNQKTGFFIQIIFLFPLCNLCSGGAFLLFQSELQWLSPLRQG